MQLGAMSERFGDALWGRHRQNSEMHLEPKIKRVRRGTQRPWSINIGEVLGGGQSGGGQSGGGQSGGGQSGGSQSGGGQSGGDQSGGSQSGGGQPGGSQSGGSGSRRRRDGRLDSIHWLTHNCGNWENWVQPGPPRDERWDWLEAGDSGSWDDAVLSVCCTWCWLMIMAWLDWEGWHIFVCLGDGRVEDKKEREEGRWGLPWWETGTWRILFASQMIILDTACMSHNPVGNIIVMRSSEPNLARWTDDFSYPLVSSISFPS